MLIKPHRCISLLFVFIKLKVYSDGRKCLFLEFQTFRAAAYLNL